MSEQLKVGDKAWVKVIVEGFVIGVVRVQGLGVVRGNRHRQRLSKG
jgi:hypothetical protein